MKQALAQQLVAARTARASYRVGRIEPTSGVAVGIELAAPDFGDAPEVRDGEVPIVWACGVTPQAAIMASRPPFAITHAPGHMMVLDVPDANYVI